MLINYFESNLERKEGGKNREREIPFIDLGAVENMKKTMTVSGAFLNSARRGSKHNRIAKPLTPIISPLSRSPVLERYSKQREAESAVVSRTPRRGEQKARRQHGKCNNRFLLTFPRLEMHSRVRTRLDEARSLSVSL